LPGTIYTVGGGTSEFTAYRTGALSADQTQVVTYYNKLDFSKLSSLSITKQKALAAGMADDEVYAFYVKLGGEPLPIGTKYTVGREVKTVADLGIIQLKAGETAVLVDGIISGTDYEVSEVIPQGASYKASYSGTAESGTIAAGKNSVTGTLGLKDSVRITVTNTDYSVLVHLPITKQALGNHGEATFRFTVKEVDGLTLEPITTRPEGTITVTDDAVTEGTIAIGIQAEETGSRFYQIAEVAEGRKRRRPHRLVLPRTI